MAACFAGAAPQASASDTGKCQRHGQRRQRHGHRGSAISNDGGIMSKCQRHRQQGSVISNDSGVMGKCQRHGLWRAVCLREQ